MNATWRPSSLNVATPLNALRLTPATPVVDTDMSVGTLRRYSNPSASTARCPFAFRTSTSASPAACDGTTAVIVVALTTTTEVAGSVPTQTSSPAPNWVPRIVTERLPAGRPAAGKMLVIVGEGSTTKV